MKRIQITKVKDRERKIKAIKLLRTHLRHGPDQAQMDLLVAKNVIENLLRGSRPAELMVVQTINNDFDDMFEYHCTDNDTKVVLKLFKCVGKPPFKQGSKVGKLRYFRLVLATDKQAARECAGAPSKWQFVEVWTATEVTDFSENLILAEWIDNK